MGNEVSSSSSGSTRNDAVSVILADGTVRELETPLTAAELMMDHPGQVVVEYRHGGGAGAQAPLPADGELAVGRVYVMLPMRRGNKLAAEELRRVLTCADSVVRARGDLLLFTGIIPVIVKAVSKGRRRPVVAAVERRLVSGKGWRPNLDTIKERNVERKLSHWLF